MDWNTILVIITVIGCFIGLSGWLTARENRISKDGEWKGMVNAKLESIDGVSNKFEKIDCDLKNYEGRIQYLEASVSLDHKRLDDHMK